MANGGTIIASTLGIDAADIGEYRYQSTRTKQPIFAINDRYFTVSKAEPKDKEYKWQRLDDQFFAEKGGTVIWFAEVDAS